MIAKNPRRMDYDSQHVESTQLKRSTKESSKFLGDQWSNIISSILGGGGGGGGGYACGNSSNSFTWSVDLDMRYRKLKIQITENLFKMKTMLKE